MVAGCAPIGGARLAFTGLHGVVELRLGQFRGARPVGGGPDLGEAFKRSCRSRRGWWRAVGSAGRQRRPARVRGRSEQGAGAWARGLRLLTQAVTPVRSKAGLLALGAGQASAASSPRGRSGRARRRVTSGSWHQGGSGYRLWRGHRTPQR